jgi:hypothetical protein
MTISASAVSNGFVPARPYYYDQCRTYATQLTGTQALAPGDPVTLANGLISPCTAGQNVNQSGYGVVVGLLNSNGRPLIFNQPNSGPILTAGGGNGQAIVLADPNMTFRVNYTGSAGNDVVGNLVEVTGVNTPVTAQGISQAAVCLAASADTSLLFRVISRFPDPTYNQSKGTPRYVEVAWNRHLLRTGASGGDQ